jgi:hypothetical protein
MTLILIRGTEPPRRRPSHHGGLRRVRVWAMRAVIFSYSGTLTDLLSRRGPHRRYLSLVAAAQPAFADAATRLLIASVGRDGL